MNNVNVLSCTDNLLLEVKLSYQEETVTEFVEKYFNLLFSKIATKIGNTDALFIATKLRQNWIGLATGLTQFIQDYFSDKVINITDGKQKVIMNELEKNPKKVIKLLDDESSNLKMKTKKAKVDYIFDIVTSFAFKYPNISKIATSSMQFIKNNPFTAYGVATAIFIILVCYLYIKIKEGKDIDKVLEEK